MGGGMKPAAAILIAIAAVARADFSPAAWHDAPLEVAAGNTNEWYFFPPANKSPRVVVKATTNNNIPSRKLLTGGPPAWTSGGAASLGAINKQGTFVTSPTDGTGYLVASHGAPGSAVLKVAVFASTGSATLETIDPNAGTITGISAEVDASGILHVGYIWNGNTICYARRTGGASGWAFTSVGLGATTLHDTAVVPSSTANEAVDLYYTATSSGVRVLWHSKPGVINSQLLIQWGANPRVEVERFVGLYLRGSRIGPSRRLYYFGSDNTNSWKLRRYAGSGTPSELETAGNVSPKSIRVATGPDGRQRVAWYNATDRRVHYLRPVTGGVDLPQLAGFPVTTTGAQADADLLGLHFDSSGRPHLLYRTTLAAGFIAFPRDDFDTDRNGRADLLDMAFLSPSDGLRMLPPEPAAAGVPVSANRFKFTFPTVGAASNTGTGSVASLSKNLVYGIETSTDGSAWTPVSGVGSVSYYLTATTGSGDQEVRTFTGVLPGDAPGGVTAKFARMTVARSPYPY
jgi:hypothetical protein